MVDAGLSLLLIGASAMTWLLLPSASIDRHPAAPTRTTELRAAAGHPGLCRSDHQPGHVGRADWCPARSGRNHRGQCGQWPRPPAGSGVGVGHPPGPGSRNRRARLCGHRVPGQSFRDDPIGLPTRSGPRGRETWLNQVEADIDVWYSYYGADLGGIFLDQTTSECGPTSGSKAYADEYRTLTAYVTKDPPRRPDRAQPRHCRSPLLRECRRRAGHVRGQLCRTTRAAPTPRERPTSPSTGRPAARTRSGTSSTERTSTAEMAHAMALGKSRNAGYRLCHRRRTAQPVRRALPPSRLLVSGAGPSLPVDGRRHRFRLQTACRPAGPPVGSECRGVERQLGIPASSPRWDNAEGSSSRPSIPNLR